MNIVFSINYLGLEGLGATLSSLVQNCSNSKELILWFFCSDLDLKHKLNIKQLLKNEHFKGDIKMVDFDAKTKFGYMKSLHGDYTTYGRLLIPELIEDDVALYLDSDLVVEVDVLDLKNIDFHDHILAAASATQVKDQLEGAFFIDKLNWHPETNYFNAGVLLLNLKKWRLDNVADRWKQISFQYPNEFISADQTLLNVLCNGKFMQLPNYYNNAWFPGVNDKEIDVKSSIIHFVGSPKPWDLLGKHLHKGFPKWLDYNTPFWSGHYETLGVDKLKRSWKIRRSLLKHLINKYFIN
ncbi:MAG: glycosyltransferase family 8 protein [Flaviramulus sp.]|nr:glycosyltransferase family 8 protein [Flaviramulus sp.]